MAMTVRRAYCSHHVKTWPINDQTSAEPARVGEQGFLLRGSIDLVELNPALDVRNGTALLAVDLVESLFGKSTLLRLHEDAAG